MRCASKNCKNVHRQHQYKIHHGTEDCRYLLNDVAGLCVAINELRLWIAPS
jgi:hypothetical protein